MHGVRRSAALLGIGLLVGCGGGGGGGSTQEQLRGVGCNLAPSATCYRYDGPWTEAQLGELEGYCADAGGAWGGCPDRADVGTCTYAESPSLTMVTIYYPGAVCDADAAGQRCQQETPGGSFEAGTGTCGTATDRTLRCDLRTTDQVCSEVAGRLAPEEAKVLAAECEVMGGSMRSGPCPAATVGTCVVPETDRTLTYGYFAADAPGASASDCANAGGSWTAAP